MQASLASMRSFWSLATAVSASPKEAPLTLASQFLGWFMSPMRRLFGGWREEWALAALEVLSHDPGAVADPSATLTAVRGALTCGSSRVRRAAATFLAVRDPASAVSARVAVAMNATEDSLERIYALQVSVSWLV